MKLRELGATAWDAARDFVQDDALRLGAALSYYAVLSLAPLLLLLLAVLGVVMERADIEQEVVAQMRDLAGGSGGEVAEIVIRQAQRPGQGALAAVLGTLILAIGASGVFVELQSAMNIIWDVRVRPGLGVWDLIRQRVLSLGIVLALAFLLLVSLTASAGLAALSRYFAEALPGGEAVWQALHVGVSIALFTVLFALLFKYLPDAVVAWRYMWAGAFVTALLFSVGKLLIGLYLGHASIGSAYGAAGSVVVLLVWVYYSSLIVLLGAEFTHALARRRGAVIRIPAHAEARRGRDVRR